MAAEGTGGAIGGRRRVLVVGARGHLGRLARAACEARGDLEVAGASRRAGADDVTLDLADPKTFGAMRDFDVIVNAADTSKAWPVDAARDALAGGRVFLETSADPEVFRELSTLDDQGEGTVVLGAGTFPGLSTALLERAPREVPLEFRARWSVLSAAGPGTVEVMVDALSRPALTFEDGAFVDSPPLSPLARREVAGRVRTVLPLSVPDVVLAPRAAEAPSARFVASVRPELPAPLLRLVGAAARRGVFGWTPIRALTAAWLTLIRGALFRRAGTPLRIELHAPDGLVAAVTCGDAFSAGAAGIAALAALWPESLTGPRLPFEGVPLATLADELRGEAGFEFGDSARPAEHSA